MSGRLWWVLVLVAGVGCESPAPAPDPWVLRVQTDLAAGVEFVRLQLDGVRADGSTALLAELAVPRGDDWSLEPRPIARIEAADLARDIVAFDVSAQDPVGAELLRDRRPRPPASGVVDVRLLRSCVGVACRGETACLGGRCVPLDCRRGDEASCPPPACSTNEECEPTGALCETFSRCRDGLCFTSIEHFRCSGRQVCNLEEGCVAIPGFGLPNAAPCTNPNECASGACVRSQCCERMCSPCESCAEGRCVVRPGSAGAEPREETCDGLDEDCDGRVDELVRTVSNDHCGGCGLRCATDEACAGVRCVVDDSCERYLGIPCDALERATLRTPQPHMSVFGRALAVDGDTLAVGAPLDDVPLLGVDQAPLEPFARNEGLNAGAVLVFRRDGADALAIEAILRVPESVPSERLRGYQLGQHLALSGSRVAAAGIREERVHFYARDDDGVWSFERTVDTDNHVAGLAFQESGDLVVLGLSTVRVIQPDGTVPWLRTVPATATEIAIDGERVAVATSRELRVGRVLGDLSNIASVNRVTALAFAGERLLAVDRNEVRVFRAGPPSWEEEGAFELPVGSTSAGAIVANEDWIIVGAPSDLLSGAPGVGADLRLREPLGSHGTVYLYPRAASGAPIDAPLYLRPLDDTQVRAFFGAALALQGDTLFASATGDDFGHGIVRLFRIAP